MAKDVAPSARLTGFRLFSQQWKALFVKNALLAWRNKAATLLQLFASFFFVFLIFAVDQAVKANIGDNTSFKNLNNPTAYPIPGIMPCNEAFYIKTPCYDFLWSGNGSAIVVDLVKNISANNPGRSIDFATQTLGFATPDDVDNWLLANPYRTTGALHFAFSPAGTLGYGVQINSTVKNVRGVFEDPTFDHLVPLQAAAERELMKYSTQNWGISFTPSFAEFPHPAIGTFSGVAAIGPTFIFAAVMFTFVIEISNLVLEKELRLRQAMATMGMLDSAYWLTWLVWEVLLSIISSIFLVLFGMMYQWDFFLNNSFGVLFCMFFFFQLAMISVAFLVSTFLSKSSSANTIGFIFFIIGFVLQLVVSFGFPYNETFKPVFRYVFNLFPPNLLALGLKYLGDATATPQDPGIKFSDIRECSARADDCVMTMAGIYLWLIVEFIAYFFIALYCDNVFPDVNGIKKPLYFFLLPSFWTGKSSVGKEGAGCCACSTRIPELTLEGGPVDADVAEEERLVREAVERGGEDDENVAISVRGLVKTFPGVTELKCCFQCKKTAPFHAVKGSWFFVEKEKLLCLLGPNGAGKSTTINCLTGIIPITAGDALVYNRSIRNPSQMQRIREDMGVCPQFDLLWEQLSGREHLFLFAKIKGLDPKQIPTEVATLLEEVRLSEAQKMRAGSYSGGMKRRLSVAVALIGDPKIVFLDEPTTGMDPVTRRYVWDIIERAKRGRAIVLTTHSMEEADILGDRVAIMAKGRLRCIGSSLHLKNKFGSGFLVTVGVRSGSSAVDVGKVKASDASMEEVKRYFKQELNVEPIDESKGYLKFAVPRSQEGILTRFFKDLNERKKDLGIIDLQLSLTTLEEVFLNIARQAELETAASEGRFDTIILPNYVTVKVPIGADTVVIPWNDPSVAPHGMIIDLTWQQDESGNLRIASSSEPRPATSPLVDPQRLGVLPAKITKRRPYSVLGISVAEQAK